MAHRYFGESLGDMYIDAEPDSGDILFTMRPEKWRTVDYSKLTEAG